MGKVQKPDRGGFSSNLHEEPHSPLKPVRRITSSLSPLAKVFRPLAAPLASANARKETFEDTASENFPIAEIKPVRNLVEYGSIIRDKVYE